MGVLQSFLYFVHDIPELSSKKSIFENLIKTRNDGGRIAYFTAPAEQAKKYKQFAENIEELKKEYPFKTIIPQLQVNEKTGTIAIIENGHSLYSDTHHLNDFGSLYFRKTFLPLIQDILTKQHGETLGNLTNKTFQ